MRKLSPKEWSRHLAAQAADGRTVKSYCDENGLDLSSFYRRRRERSSGDTGGEPQAFVLAPAFVPSKVSGSTLSIRVHDFSLTLDPGYGSDDLEGVLLALAKVQRVLRCE